MPKSVSKFKIKSNVCSTYYGHRRNSNGVNFGAAALVRAVGYSHTILIIRIISSAEIII